MSDKKKKKKRSGIGEYNNNESRNLKKSEYESGFRDRREVKD